MKAAFTALLLILTACSSGGEPAPAGGKLAIVGADGNLSTYDPATGVVTGVTTDASSRRFYSQPTWSPDGTRLAFAASATATEGPGVQAAGPTARVSLEAQGGVQGAIHIVDADGEQETTIVTPFPAFYLYWAPNGGHLAFLGNDLSIGQLRLGMIDLQSGNFDLIDVGQPYYFAWAPESDRMLVHRGDAELFFLTVDGGRDPIGTSPGGFSAPSWIGETLLFGWDGGGGKAIQLADRNGSVRHRGKAYTGGVALGLNPDEERFAYIDISDPVNPFSLGPLVVAGQDGETEVADDAAAFFWDVTGTRLLYLTSEVGADTFALRWNVWDGTDSLGFDPFLPTATFVQQYLPFFGQYANSLSFLSPDGGSFTFTGRIEGRGEGIWTQQIAPDTPAVLVAAGEFSTWAPQRAPDG